MFYGAACPFRQHCVSPENTLDGSKFSCPKNSAEMYYLTICAGDELLEERVKYQDYADAIAACGQYYEPRSAGSVLSFTSEVRGKKFMRSYAQLSRLEDLGESVGRLSPQGLRAVKSDNAFVYAKSYTFLIESELGARETDWFLEEDAKEDEDHQDERP